MIFETEPTFQRFNVGVGIIRVHTNEGVVATTSCQFAAFGGKTFGSSAPLVRAEPIEADRPLEQSLDGAIALVARGKCSFEAKLRAAAAAGASGVILMNNEDETFVAAPDAPAAAACIGGTVASPWRVERAATEPRGSGAASPTSRAPSAAMGRRGAWAAAHAAGGGSATPVLVANAAIHVPNTAC